MRAAILGLAMLTALGACAEGDDLPRERTDVSPVVGLPEGHPPVQPGTDGPATRGGPGGEVLETRSAGGYTYARVESEGERIWSVGPPTELEVGDSVTLVGAVGMRDFTSAALGRTFETILFVESFRAPDADEMVGGLDRTAEGFVGSGRVLEIIPAASYTYLRVDVDGEDIWLAGPETALEVGQEVEWAEGMLMQNFASRALDRTFEAILFVGELRVLR